MKEEEKIQWHPAFYGAIQAELIEYRDVLYFEAEHQLTTEPLRIDVPIIRKQPDAVIRKNIAAIFRTINICEFKSPDDSFSVEDYYKICAYANLYRALHRKDPVTASPIEMRDMTLTISVTARPVARLVFF
jgi:hypothetical protein